jgi:hypothetical protein
VHFETLYKGEAMSLVHVHRGTQQSTGQIDPHEISLRDEPFEENRAFKIGVLIFSITFCGLVFWAGWKEAAAYKECGLRGALTVGRACSATPSQQAPLLKSTDTPR